VRRPDIRQVQGATSDSRRSNGLASCVPRGAGAPAERIGYAPQRERRSPRRQLCTRRCHGESRAQCRIVPRRVRIANLRKNPPNLVRSGNDLVLVAELAGHRRLENRRRYSLPSAADRQAAMGAHGEECGYPCRRLPEIDTSPQLLAIPYPRIASQNQRRGWRRRPRLLGRRATG